MSNQALRTELSSSHPKPSTLMTSTGIAGEFVNVLVTGNLPKGETTRKVTYLVVDRNTKAMLSEIFLPDASNRFDSVSMLLKVRQCSGGYDIGTFAEDGEFTPAGFLSVGIPQASPPAGPSGRIA
ncbi:hypothetical protein ACVW1C_001048 [Bradyrhizobium sp. USDA 4011]